MSLPAQDEAVQLLANRTRLQIIRALQVRGGRLDLERLAELLTKPGLTPAADVRARKRREQELLLTHIPKMQELGVVEYDQKSNIVALQQLSTKVATELESVLLLLFDLLRGGKSQ